MTRQKNNYLLTWQTVTHKKVSISDTHFFNIGHMSRSQTCQKRLVKKNWFFFIVSLRS
jgi:hypothetical protein